MENIRLKGPRGFTLIELLAVIAIIGILAALVAGTVTGIGQGGQTARLAGDQNSIGKAADRFSTEALTGVYPVVSLDDTDADLNPENDPRLAADLGVRLIDFDAGLPQDANKTFVPNFLKEVPDSAGLVSWRIVESTGNAFFAEDGSFLARPSDARLDVDAGSSSGSLSSTVPTERSDYTLKLEMTKGDAAIELLEVTIPGGYNVGSQALSEGSVVGRLLIEFAEDNSWDSGETITVAAVDVTVAATNQWEAVVDYDDNSTTGSAGSSGVDVKDTEDSNSGESTHTDVRTHTISITPPVGDSPGTITMTMDRENDNGYVDSDANEATETFTLEIYGRATDLNDSSKTVNLLRNPSVSAVYRWLAKQQTSISVEGVLEILAGNQAVIIKGTPLASLVVTPSTESVETGSSAQFTATGTFDDGSTEDLSSSVDWSSDNPDVTIDSSGLATVAASAASEDTAEITATLGSLSDTAVLTVTEAVLESIEVTPTDPDPISASTGGSQQFAATGSFSDGSSGASLGSVVWAATPLISGTGHLSTAMGCSPCRRELQTDCTRLPPPRTVSPARRCFSS